MFTGGGFSVFQLVGFGFAALTTELLWFHGQSLRQAGEKIVEHFAANEHVSVRSQKGAKRTEII